MDSAPKNPACSDHRHSPSPWQRNLEESESQVVRDTLPREAGAETG